MSNPVAPAVGQVWRDTKRNRHIQVRLVGEVWCEYTPVAKAGDRWIKNGIRRNGSIRLENIKPPRFELVTP